MSSYERLRYSFDNILKELDDICKSIDDLADIDDELESNGSVNPQAHRLVDQVPSSNAFNNGIVRKSSPIMPRSAVRSGSNLENFKQLSFDQQELKRPKHPFNNRFQAANNAYEIYKKNIARSISNEFGNGHSISKLENQLDDYNNNYNRRNQMQNGHHNPGMLANQRPNQPDKNGNNYIHSNIEFNGRSASTSLNGFSKPSPLTEEPPAYKNGPIFNNVSIKRRQIYINDSSPRPMTETTPQTAQIVPSIQVITSPSSQNEIVSNYQVSPASSQYLTPTSSIRIQGKGITIKRKKHRLPSEDQASLNNIIGSVQENILFNKFAFPMTTSEPTSTNRVVANTLTPSSYSNSISTLSDSNNNGTNNISSKTTANDENANNNAGYNSNIIDKNSGSSQNLRFDKEPAAYSAYNSSTESYNSIARNRFAKPTQLVNLSTNIAALNYNSLSQNSETRSRELTNGGNIPNNVNLSVDVRETEPISLKRDLDFESEKPLTKALTARFLQDEKTGENGNDDGENADKNGENKSESDYQTEEEAAEYECRSNNDYLNAHERAKIEYFYNSMGCYVYVSRCIAEMYQIKREDEFDAIDNDPVSDYFQFMKNKRRGSNNLNDGTNEDVEDELYLNELNNQEDEPQSIEENKQSATNINYTYINSGVPVIVFNYGANPKRGKDLRILLAERDTGFCMWEFKFDRLTQFDNSGKTTIIRLTLKEPFGGIQSQQSALKYSNSSAFAGSTTSSMNYHNEYFEKLFNSKNRHAHKEFLLKFVIKRDCDEFCYKLTKIMKDKRNEDLFELQQNYNSSNGRSGMSSSRDQLLASNMSLNSIVSQFSSRLLNLNSRAAKIFQLSSCMYNKNGEGVEAISSDNPVSAALMNNAASTVPGSPMHSSSVIITHFEFQPIKKSQSSVSNMHAPSKLTKSSTIIEKYPAKNDKNMSMSSLSICRFNDRIVIEDFVDLRKDLSHLNPQSQPQPDAYKQKKSILHRESSIASFTTPFVHSKTIQSFLNRADSLSTNLNDISSNRKAIEENGKNGKPSLKVKSNSFMDVNSMQPIMTNSVSNTALNKKSDSNGNGKNNFNQSMSNLILKFKKLRKSDISAPVNFNHVTHLDKPVPIGKRYKLNY